MKTKRLLAALLSILLLSATLSGCAETKTFSIGKTDGNTYSNEFLGTTLKLPDSWTIATTKELGEIFEISDEVLANYDGDAEKQAKLAEEESQYLLYASKHPSDYIDGYNASLNIISTNLGLAGLAVSDPKDYVQIAIDDMKSSDPSYTFDEIKTEKIGETEFATSHITADLGEGITCVIRIYCMIKNNYAVAITASGADDAELAEVDAIIKGGTYN